MKVGPVIVREPFGLDCHSSSIHGSLLNELKECLVCCAASIPDWKIWYLGVNYFIVQFGIAAIVYFNPFIVGTLPLFQPLCLR